MRQSLLSLIKDIITHDGPISVEHYMGLCLSHYYSTRDPLGVDGDFITAPEISQVFGELIGLWMIQTWMDLGQPSKINWIELGPGRGTLTADVLRTLKIMPALLDKLSIHLVETSPVLIDKQKRTLKDYSVQWHKTLKNIPDGPTFFMANEFFDALAVRQFVKTNQNWHERMVGLRDDQLVFGLSPEPALHINRMATPEVIIEVPVVSQNYIQQIASHLNKNDGIALIIDYGYWGPKLGDTLQALSQHRFTPPLKDPGEADLTTHVDFQALACEAWNANLNAHGLSTQRDFLYNLGLEIRAQRLLKSASPKAAPLVQSAVDRLTATGNTGMGELFKVLCLSSPSIKQVPALRMLRT